jgi:protein-tyrosine-phosphatase
MSSWKETVQAHAGIEPPLVLFLGRTNAATSILAEAILRHLAQGRVRAASAGDAAALQVNPYALECLLAHRIPTTELFCKPWAMFFGYYRPPVRVLITLCDPDTHAARVDWNYEVGHTVKVNWPTPDPEATAGSETDMRLAFEEAFVTLEARIRQFLALPLHRLSDGALSKELERIGETQGDPHGTSRWQ